MKPREWLERLLVWSPGQRDSSTVALVLMVLWTMQTAFLHLDQTWNDVLAGGASAVCPGVGAESVPSCAYPAVGH